MTNWKRLASRPRSRPEDLRRNYQAQIRDPLWFLARQWQLGEFEGDDAASPYWVSFKAQFAKIESIRANHRPPESYKAALDPLVKKIEGESVLRDNYRFKVKIGRKFEKLLSSNITGEEERIPIMEAYRTAFKIPAIPKVKRVKTMTALRGDFSARLDRGDLPYPIYSVLENETELNEDLLVERTGPEILQWKVLDPVNKHAFVIERDPRFDTEFIIYRAVLQDLKTYRFLKLFSKRAIDGIALMRAISREEENLIDQIGRRAQLSETNRALLVVLHKELTDWAAGTYGNLPPEEDKSDFWVPEQLEYQGQLLTRLPSDNREPIALEIHPGLRGELDWYSMDQKMSDHDESSDPPEIIELNMYPTRVSFRGMPNKRWWQFENGLVDFGNIGIEEFQLDKIAFTGFLTEFSNDWYVVPFTQKAGTLCKVEHLIVHDVFGGKTLVERADREERDPWTLFSNTILDGQNEKTGDYFFLPPAASSFILDSDPIEEVRFLRDEMANMVWGVEHLTENGLGDPWLGYERAVAGKLDALQNDHSTAELKYFLSRNAPENWIPFLPVQISGQRKETVLKKGAMLSDVVDVFGDRLKILASSKLLNPNGAGKSFRLREEEVPRTGVKASRIIRRSRWINGSAHLWIGQTIGLGRGEGWSGLAFDVVKNTSASSSDKEPSSPPPPFLRILDDFKKPINSQHFVCNTKPTPADKPPLTFPLQLEGGIEKANRICWIDYHEDISSNLLMDSGNPLIIDRQIHFACGSYGEAGEIARATVDFIQCNSNSCDLYFHSEGKVSIHQLGIRYGLPSGEYFDLRRYKGVRLKVKENNREFYITFSTFDHNGQWTSAPDGIPITVPPSLSPQNVEILLNDLVLRSPGTPNNSQLNRIFAISILLQGKGDDNHFVFEKIEFF